MESTLEQRVRYF